MKEKICFNKSYGVGIIVAVFFFLIAFLFNTITSQKLSTNSRASTNNLAVKNGKLADGCFPVPPFTCRFGFKCVDWKLGDHPGHCVAKPKDCGKQDQKCCVFGNCDGDLKCLKVDVLGPPTSLIPMFTCQ